MAALLLTLLACPGCLTAQVVKYAASPSASDGRAGLCAIGQVASGSRTIQLAASTFSCRATVAGEVSSTTTFERISADRATGIARSGERLVAAYAVSWDQDPEVAVIETEDTHVFALREGGGWTRTPVSTFKMSSSGSPSALRWFAAAPLLPLACLGDAVIGVVVAVVFVVALPFMFLAGIDLSGADLSGLSWSGP